MAKGGMTTPPRLLAGRRPCASTPSSRYRCAASSLTASSLRARVRHEARGFSVRNLRTNFNGSINQHQRGYTLIPLPSCSNNGGHLSVSPGIGTPATMLAFTSIAAPLETLAQRL